MTLLAPVDLSAVTRTGILTLSILGLASLAVALLRWLRPAMDTTELLARVRSWWWMAGIFLVIILARDGLALVFFAFLSFWAFKEYVTLLQTRPADHRSLLWSFAAVPLQYYWIALPWYGMFTLFIPVYMFLLLPVQLVLAQEPKGFVASASQLQWGLMAFVFGLSHLGALLALPLVAAPQVHGRTLLLFLVFVVEISDVLQYVWGKTLGRHRVLPSISPNKTWEGLLGGVTCAVLCSLGLRFLTPFSVVETLGVACLITLAGFAGGAVMSAVKRDFGVKDFGTLIPGHGGMVDRVDALCYAAPLFFHYVRYVHTV